MDRFLQAAIEEAKKGLAAGGIPIGSVLVCDGEVIGRGHNQRVQQGSVIHHAEMNCLENAGRLTAAVYARCTLYSTLSPCPMCSGAALLYKIPRIVVGENRTFQVDHAVGVAPLVVIPADQLEERGVQLDAGAGVEDREAGVVDEVGGDHFVVGVFEDALEVGLAGLLHGGA
jgi:cytosine/creatinine deaminase